MGQQGSTSWFRTNALTILGVILTALALYVPYDIFFRERSTKALQAVLLTNTQLVQVQGDVENDIIIYYQNQPVSDLTLLEVRIENSGTEPIQVGDFEQSIYVQLPEAARILSEPKFTKAPQNLSMEIKGFPTPQGFISSANASPTPTSQTTTLNSIELTPALFNPGDSITLQMFVTDIPDDRKDNPFTLDIRIAGISTVPIVSSMAEQQASTLSDYRRIIAAGILGVGITLVFTAITLGARNARQTATGFHYPMNTLLTMTGMILTMVSIYVLALSYLSP